MEADASDNDEVEMRKASQLAVRSWRPLNCLVSETDDNRDLLGTAASCACCCLK